MSSDEFLHLLMRLQFGLSASFHFLFVPLSIGLLLCMNILQTAHVVTKSDAFHRAARFWGRFFLLVWATGILTGYPLRWQLTDVWSQYLQTAAPVLKEIFSIEGVVAPLMIASVVVVTCLRGVLPAMVIMVTGWALLILLGIQSMTILSINAWMQDPSVVSYESGAWHLGSLWRILLSDTAINKTFHTLAASLLSGAFFVFALSSHHLRQGRHLAVSRVSFRVAAWVGLGSIIAVLWSGHHSAAGVARVQPMKFAAFEGHWKADPGLAPLVLWAWPDEHAEHNRQEVAVPFLLSILGTQDMSSPPGIIDLTEATERKLTQAWLSRTPPAAEGRPGWLPGLDPSLQLPGQDDQRAWLRLRESVALQQGDRWETLSHEAQIKLVAQAARPPVTVVFLAFRTMVGSGMLCLGLCALVFVKRDALLRGQHATLMSSLRWVLPLPWLAILSGWAVAELGRQPWTIYEHLPTFHAGTLPSLEGGVLTFFAMLLAGTAIATTFTLAARSIIRVGPDAAHWLDMGSIYVQRWLTAWGHAPQEQHAAMLDDELLALAEVHAELNQGEPPFDKAA